MNSFALFLNCKLMGSFFSTIPTKLFLRGFLWSIISFPGIIIKLKVETVFPLLSVTYNNIIKYDHDKK